MREERRRQTSRVSKSALETEPSIEGVASRRAALGDCHAGSVAHRIAPRLITVLENNRQPNKSECEPFCQKACPGSDRARGYIERRNDGAKAFG